MASADMLRLMDNCRVRLPGALDAAIQQEMFSALDQMLQTSQLWYEDVSFSVSPTEDTYEENPAAYTHALVPTLGRIARLQTVSDEKGNIFGASMPVIPNVILDSVPSEVTTYIARVILTVSAVDGDGYPVLPDWIMQKYHTQILDGVLGRMMSQIAKPYSSPQMAATHLRLFNASVRRAKVEALRENTYGTQRWFFPQSFNRR